MSRTGNIRTGTLGVTTDCSIQPPPPLYTPSAHMLSYEGVFVIKGKKKWWIAAGFLLFVLYIFAAPRPIPRETVIVPRWLSSLDSDSPVALSPEMPEAGIFPFRLGGRFGYSDTGGRFIVNRAAEGYVSQSQRYWAEYGGEAETFEVRNPQSSSNDVLFTVENGMGYPLFLDDRIFIVGRDQNSLTALDDGGSVLWTYDFAATLTCIDAAASLILTGSLDGTVELLDANGARIFFFEPGGSRRAVISGCAMSADGSRLAIISGVDDQRFLLLERFGERGDYKVIYHEFLEDGFRRPVFVSFTDGDTRIVFERSGGIGVYTINARGSLNIPLEGDVVSMDDRGSDGLFFLITSQSAFQKRLVVVRFPGSVVMEAPFRSAHVFFHREGPRFYVGGGNVMAAFELEKK
jgi:hypothetical protein